MTSVPKFTLFTYIFKKPIVILVDDFDVIPSDLKDKCELIVTDEITDVAKMKMTLYSL